jgi:hypothetical protein
MPYDIDWETACNDFHPAFALVRGERYEPDAKPFPPSRLYQENPRRPEPAKRILTRSASAPELIR